METATRKRPAEGGEEARRTKARGGEEEMEETDRSVTDDKVDEFFAILSRIREATRCFPVRDGNGGVRRRSTAAEGLWRWQPRFQREDFEDASGVRDDGRWRGTEDVASGGELVEEERVAENTIPGRLDLNADPASEAPGLGSMSGDSTAPVAT
ncbi:protein NEGATIVE REGULATOR OF RESISTANCE-like [Elaeis guineensis]|uniref:protein NEGATIVE REGULATOR OF RESISTANCE-like n=1 Tax=Elaeis guineensis var. tenera TaxID=51953 RepID=UPI003C6D73FC